MLFHVAGGRPFGELGRVVFVNVRHNGFEDVQGNRGFVGRVFQSAGGSGLRARARAFGLDGRLKVGDVRAELRDEGGGQAKADELRGERRRIGLKGAGGVEQRRVAGAAGHEKFSLESRRAHQHEGMCGVGDMVQVVVEMKAPGDLGHDARVRGFRAGDLRGSEGGGLGHGGGDEGELLSAHAGAGKIGGIFCAEGGGGFEGCGEAGDFVFHNEMFCLLADL